jgi:hypothetical protein
MVAALVGMDAPSIGVVVFHLHACMADSFPQADLPEDVSLVICHRLYSQVHHQDSQAHPKVAACNLIVLQECQGSVRQV